MASAIVRVDVGVVVLVTHRALFGIIERPGQEKAFWSRFGVRFGIGIPNVDCTAIERFLIERPRLLARVGCFPNAAFFHVDVGRSRGIWFDASVGTD